MKKRQKKIWGHYPKRKYASPRLLDGRGSKIEVKNKTPRLVSALEAASIMSLSKIRVKQLCQENRLEGAFKVGNQWIIPVPIVRLPPVRREGK